MFIIELKQIIQDVDFIDMMKEIKPESVQNIKLEVFLVKKENTMLQQV